jgi:hypothetical protein
MGHDDHPAPQKRWFKPPILLKEKKRPAICGFPLCPPMTTPASLDAPKEDFALMSISAPSPWRGKASQMSWNMNASHLGYCWTNQSSLGWNMIKIKNNPHNPCLMLSTWHRTSMDYNGSTEQQDIGLLQLGIWHKKRQGIASWRSFCCSRSVLQGKVSPYHYEMLDVDSPFPGTTLFGLLDSFRTLHGFDLLNHVLFRSDPPSPARGRASLGSRWACRTGPDSTGSRRSSEF